jgi:hypothetical protein
VQRLLPRELLRVRQHLCRLTQRPAIGCACSGFCGATSVRWAWLCASDRCAHANSLSRTTTQPHLLVVLSNGP